MARVQGTVAQKWAVLQRVEEIKAYQDYADVGPELAFTGHEGGDPKIEDEGCEQEIDNVDILSHKL